MESSTVAHTLSTPERIVAPELGADVIALYEELAREKHVQAALGTLNEQEALSALIDGSHVETAHDGRQVVLSPLMKSGEREMIEISKLTRSEFQAVAATSITENGTVVLLHVLQPHLDKCAIFERDLDTRKLAEPLNRCIEHRTQWIDATIRHLAEAASVSPEASAIWSRGKEWVVETATRVYNRGFRDDEERAALHPYIQAPPAGHHMFEKRILERLNLHTALSNKTACDLLGIAPGSAIEPAHESELKRAFYEKDWHVIAAHSSTNLMYGYKTYIENLPVPEGTQAVNIHVHPVVSCIPSLGNALTAENATYDAGIARAIFSRFESPGCFADDVALCTSERAAANLRLTVFRKAIETIEREGHLPNLADVEPALGGFHRDKDADIRRLLTTTQTEPPTTDAERRAMEYVTSRTTTELSAIIRQIIDTDTTIVSECTAILAAIERAETKGVAGLDRILALTTWDTRSGTFAESDGDTDFHHEAAPLYDRQGRRIDLTIGVIANPLGRTVVISSVVDPRTEIVAQVGAETSRRTLIECRPGHRLGDYELVTKIDNRSISIDLDRRMAATNEIPRAVARTAHGGYAVVLPAPAISESEMTGLERLCQFDVPMFQVREVSLLGRRAYVVDLPRDYASSTDELERIQETIRGVGLSGEALRAISELVSTAHRWARVFDGGDVNANLLYENRRESAIASARTFDVDEALIRDWCARNRAGMVADPEFSLAGTLSRITDRLPRGTSRSDVSAVVRRALEMPLDVLRTFEHSTETP